MCYAWTMKTRSLRPKTLARLRALTSGAAPAPPAIPAARPPRLPSVQVTGDAVRRPRSRPRRTRPEMNPWECGCSLAVVAAMTLGWLVVWAAQAWLR